MVRKLGGEWWLWKPSWQDFWKEVIIKRLRESWTYSGYDWKNNLIYSIDMINNYSHNSIDYQFICERSYFVYFHPFISSEQSHVRTLIFDDVESAKLLANHEVAPSTSKTILPSHAKTLIFPQHWWSVFPLNGAHPTRLNSDQAPIYISHTMFH